MWLAIETATDRASVALGDPGSEILEESMQGARRHAAALLPMVDRLLRRRGVTVGDVSGIVLSDGPGSFTGLRVGAAAVKALVQTRGLPLRCAPSLLVRAAGVARDNPVVLAISNALRGELYAAAYRFGGRGVEVELPPTVLRPGDLVGAHLRPDLLVGEAPAELVAATERAVGRSLIGPPRGVPEARRLIELLRLRGGATPVDDVASWEPVYGRPAEAQARWESAHGRPLPDSVGHSR
jgi:tRNA threonylcarbamoyladenosine biosynthesis protein TsaB